MNPFALSAAWSYSVQIFNYGMFICGVLDNWSSLDGVFLPLMYLYVSNGACVSGYDRLSYVGLAILLWSVRLGLQMVARFFVRAATDSRANAIRNKGGLTAIIFWFGIHGSWEFICCLPFVALLHFNNCKMSAPIGSTPSDLVGIPLFALGFVMQTVTDWQKFNAYRLKHNSQRYNLGLFFNFTRNPNFVGEFFVWLGIALVSSADLTGYPKLLVFLAPAFTLWVMLRGAAANAAERINSEKYGGTKDYEAYRKNTSMFFPVPRFIYTRLPSVIRETVLMDWESWRGQKKKLKKSS